MKLIFIGPQGSGKGTQAKILSEELRIPHISTGDLIRSTDGKLKEEVDSYINKGNLISDGLMLRILKERLHNEDCKKGFILDGFPRTMSQAKELGKLTDIDKVIEIDISNEEAIRRLSGRRNCPKCGRIYNLATSPKPEEDALCDECKISLIQREDDFPHAIKKRLEIYHEETEPILNKFDAIKINGEDEIKKITKEILKKLR
ncbi:adenylate kinase [Candidatus Pacearchaeota archaeon CG10_big_fil_rev_8_21_14_0_10_34_12]|nr:MAG: adenylate kinase [Candidatus Pacearchaeota archaeon CG10_big_fil_rev_8_21_14_0_10_34_12]